MNSWKTLTNGIIKENPVLVLVLGTCPTIAVTTMAMNGLGMGIATLLAVSYTHLDVYKRQTYESNPVRTGLPFLQDQSPRTIS